MGLIITVKWSLVPSLGNWRGGANSLGLLDRHHSRVPVSLVKILINCDRPVEFLVCCSVIPVLVGLKSPHTTVSPSGCCDRNESTLYKSSSTLHVLRVPCVAGQIYLFTSFSVHTPAQRECARTGLRSHARDLSSCVGSVACILARFLCSVVTSTVS